MKLRVFLFLLACSVRLAGGTFVQCTTGVGTLVFELYDAEKPVTVANFLTYVRSGVYTNMFSHRLIPGFVMQAGGFTVTNLALPEPDFARVANFGKITNEYNVGPKRSNIKGSIAMAKLPGDPNSASSEWFINLADNSGNLDNQNGGFTVFGHVVGGLEVMELFNKFTSVIPLALQPTNRLVNVTGTVDFPMVHYPANNTDPHEFFDNLLYIRLEELPLSLNAVSKEGKVAWTGIPWVTNAIETATSLKGPWNTGGMVVPTNTAAALSLPIPAGGTQFYRLRINP